MFFSLSPTPDQRFPNHDRLGDWWFSHDNGWTETDSGWRKGYCHEDIDHGNFVEVQLQNSEIKLVHDRHRSFPLWWNDGTRSLTNLLGVGIQLWADETITLDDRGLQTNKTDVVGNIQLLPLSMQQVVEAAYDNLAAKADRLDRDLPGLPKRLFLTGGIDTLVLASVLSSRKQKIEYIDYNHFEFDVFTDTNLGDIRDQCWGYRNMHHWREPSVLITGGCGDEYAMRGPDTIAVWAAWHDLDLEDMLSKSQGYHVKYFMRPKNLEKIKQLYDQRSTIKDRYPEYRDLIQGILDINANDHQHWHLGNTLHWTPFKDLELLKIFLRLNYDDMLKQIIDAAASKALIEHARPGLLPTLSEDKNLGHRKNLHKLPPL